MTAPLRVLAIGAHPDDCDLKAGGIGIKYADQGHDVRFLSLTDGVAGHHDQDGATLVRRRAREAKSAAAVAGVEYEIWPNRDGQLRPSLENRKRMIRSIREYDPNLIVTHRPYDYHPDHRYTSRIVRDAAYMVRVPNVCPETPALNEDPVVAYFYDKFTTPIPFDPDVVVAIDDVIEQKFDMLDCHESQVYEWLPYSEGLTETVPTNPTERREWLASGALPHVAAMERVADRFRESLLERYGEEKGPAVRYAEALEECEYGRPLNEVGEQTLFPFDSQ